MKLGKVGYTFLTGGVLLIGATALLFSLGGNGDSVTYVDASGNETPAPPGTTIVNHNYPEGTAPPDQRLSLSAESAAGEYQVRLSLASETAMASVQQGITCTAASFLIEAMAEAQNTGIPVERILLEKVKLIQGQGSKGWELVDRVSFRAQDRQKFFDPTIDLAALNEALTIASNGGSIPVCEVIPETVFAPQVDLVEAGGSYLRLKRQVPTMAPSLPEEVAQEPDINAGETE